MITACDVYKSFNNMQVLSGTSFYIRKGETIGLLGANGAGKTTLFRIMCGLMTPDAGMIYMNNRDSAATSRTDISVFFGGSARVYDRLTAWENISYFAQLHQIPKKIIAKRIDYFSHILDMHTYLHRKGQNFSHGMKQKTALVRMVVTDPEILLLDEPTTGMDIPAVESVLSFIHECALQHKTILYSSHSVTELERICDRIIILHNGIITDQLSVLGEPGKAHTDTELIYLNRIR